MPEPRFRLPRRNHLPSALTVVAALAVANTSALAQTPQGQVRQPLPVWAQPSRPPQTATAAPPSPVIARVGGRNITQADFDKVSEPYYQQLRSTLGPAFTGDVMKVAQQSVMQELIRREVLAIEVQRQKVEATQAEVDALLMLDPFFITNGKFDVAKFNAYKTAPGSNYMELLPRFRQMAAMNKLDDMTRKRLTPTPAQVRAEWEKRNDQVRFQMLPLMMRDISTEPEATEVEWEQYYDAHPDQFTRKTRLSLRYLRQPLPPAGDSTRRVVEQRALARARGVADSLRAATLSDSAAELIETGPFEIPVQVVPGIGRVQALLDTLNRVDQDSTIRVVGPYSGLDEVVVGVIIRRTPRVLPPLNDVLGDVKRRADAEKRGVAAEAERRAFYEAHRSQWRSPRAMLTRVTLDPATLVVKPPAPADIERWYAQHGHSLFGIADTSHAWLPPITDSLRTVVATRMTAAGRVPLAAEAMGKVAAALPKTRDARGLAKANGAMAETLTVIGGVRDSLFSPGLVDSLITPANFVRSAVHGPRQFGRHWVVWRTDALDTTFVPPYETARLKSDPAFNEDRRLQEEAEGRTYFDAHRGEFKTPVKYAFDYVAVPILSPDSVKISNADIRRAYEANQPRYKQDEQVKARHILFTTQGPAPDPKQKARADSLLSAIRVHGEDFAEMARTFSQEPGATTSGGDLGWFGRGRMVKEFEDAAFALKPGAISNVVKTQFGYHIILVEEHKPAGTKPFSEVREEIRTTLARARADSTSRRNASAVRRRLAQGDSTAAAPYGGVVKAAPIGVNESLGSIGYPQNLPQDLPRLSLGKWAPGVYHAGNHYVTVRLRDTLPERPAEFDEVKPQATEAARQAKRRAVLDGKAAAIRTALAAGATLDSMAAPYGGLRDSGPVSRNATFVPMLGMEPRVVQKAFAIDSGAVTDTMQVTQGVVWLRGQGRMKQNAAAYKEAAKGIEAELARKRYGEWLDQRKKAVKVEILRADLKPAPTAPTVTFTPGG